MHFVSFTLATSLSSSAIPFSKFNQPSMRTQIDFTVMDYFIIHTLLPWRNSQLQGSGLDKGEKLEIEQNNSMIKDQEVFG